HPAAETVGRGHRDRPHLALAQVLRHLEGKLLRVGEDVLVLDALDQQRVVDGRQSARLELDVDDRPDDLNDLARAHASAPSITGSSRPRRPQLALLRLLAPPRPRPPPPPPPCFNSPARPPAFSSSLVYLSP